MLDDPATLPPPKTAAQKSLLQRPSNSAKNANTDKSVVKLASYNAGSENLSLDDRASKRIAVPAEMPELPFEPEMQFEPVEGVSRDEFSQPIAMDLPTQWPDPQGFIPAPPKPLRPVASAQSEPIISHMRSYNGSDGDFTQALSDYYYFRDDGRFGGWEAYLQRSEDFIRFCCHQHMVETLAARGGELKSRTVVRWPLNRYER